MLRKLLASFGIGVANNSKKSTVTSYCRRCVARSSSALTNGSLKLLFGQNSNIKIRSIVTNLNMKLQLMGILMTQQCNRVAALRLKRAYQILVLYQRLYGEQILMQKLKSSIRWKKRPILTLLSASVFKWETERVTDEELNKCYEEIREVNKLVELSHHKFPQVPETVSHKQELQEWEQLIDRPDFKIWRRLIPDTNLFQYRVFGHFGDISPRAFYNTQVDLNYWKDWDQNTLEVKVIDQDKETSSEVVHWVYKFPYPMYPRDYVYVRRCKIDPDAKLMVIIARATDHPSCPEDNKHVRVATYCSQMVIKPYSTFDENGLQYVMTYFDDPKTNFPPMCYNWLASTGVHEFLERVHRAAKKKHDGEAPVTRKENTSGNIYTKMVHHS